MSDDDKFAKYRRAAGDARPKTWPGWALACVLLAASIACWLHAAPVYFKFGKTADRAATAVDAVAPPQMSGLAPGELAIAVLDVGQGDCIFIRTPLGKTLLIDSGEGQSPDYRYAKAMDSANRVVLPFLDQLGVRRIDHLIGTHPHSDHIGAVPDLLADKSIEIGEYWGSGFPHPSHSNKNTLKMVQRRGIAYRQPKPDELPIQIELGPDVSLWVLFVNPEADDNNNSSIVVKLVYGKTSFLFTGDAEMISEKEMVRLWGPALQADVLKVGHHGSKTSSSDMFLKYVKPSVALVCVGSYNTFGHPTPEVMERLRRYGAAVYRTDLNGHIMIFSDGNTYRVEPART